MVLKPGPIKQYTRRPRRSSEEAAEERRAKARAKTLREAKRAAEKEAKEAKAREAEQRRKEAHERRNAERMAKGLPSQEYRPRQPRRTKVVDLTSPSDGVVDLTSPSEASSSQHTSQPEVSTTTPLSPPVDPSDTDTWDFATWVRERDLLEASGKAAELLPTPDTTQPHGAHPTGVPDPEPAPNSSLGTAPQQQQQQWPATFHNFGVQDFASEAPVLQQGY